MTGDKFFDRQLVTTDDGSSSIFLPQLNEHYHSHHGAIQESQYVFMKMGWEEQSWQPRVDILEIGFGTGLNAWLVLNELLLDPTAPMVHYTTLDLFPVAQTHVEQLGYWNLIAKGNKNEHDHKKLFLDLHSSPWNAETEIYSGFVLEKLNISLLEFENNHLYDLIFFDAFSPQSQPELWTKEIFDRMFASMNKGGILVTYCAKGEVRRNMMAAGFTVERIAGPPGKREMLRAKRP